MSILIDENTTFIVQGITGREAVNLTRECLEYGRGAKIVGGVTPGRLGRDVHGVPVFDTVAQAVEHHGGSIDGSVVTVPPAFTKDAVFEALENGVKLVVIVTERIPRRDVAEMVELANERVARIISGMSSIRSATEIPASARRAIFSLAVSSLPSTIVPAWPKLMPGISSMNLPAMKATIASREARSLTQRASSASIRPPGSL